MSVLVKFLQRFVSPFLAGGCAAAAAAAEEFPAMAILLAAAAIFAFASLPAGGQMIKKLVRPSR